MHTVTVPASAADVAGMLRTRAISGAASRVSSSKSSAVTARLRVRSIRGPRTLGLVDGLGVDAVARRTAVRDATDERDRRAQAGERPGAHVARPAPADGVVADADRGLGRRAGRRARSVPSSSRTSGANSISPAAASRITTRSSGPWSANESTISHSSQPVGRADLDRRGRRPRRGDRSGGRKRSPGWPLASPTISLSTISACAAGTVPPTVVAARPWIRGDERYGG